MSDRDAHRAFESAGAFLRGHFVYTSGRHGADYLEKFRILQDPRATSELASMIVDAVYVERGEPGGRVLRRGFEILPDTRVMVVDDVVTTGGSLIETQACITNAGGVVIGIGVLADRTAGRVATDVPFYACLTVDFPSYEPDACPLCASGVPVAPPRGSSKVKLPSASRGAL